MRTLKFYLIKIMYFLTIIMVFKYTQQSYAQKNEPFKTNFNTFENNNIKLHDVVQFKIMSINDKNIQLQLITKENFKIYEEKLKFHLVQPNIFPLPLKYIPNHPAEIYFDPFYKKEKKIFKNNAKFSILISKKQQNNAMLEIDVQSCSHSVCLTPSKLVLPLAIGQHSNPLQKTETMQLSLLNNSFENFINPEIKEPTALDVNQNKQNEANPNNSFIVLNDSLAVAVQDAIVARSWILFPILLLAGLLTNLTPCVYPMIPITLNVMLQYGKIIHKRTLSFFYVLGMIITYSILGVFAGMSGSVFGAHLASPIVNITIAILMFILGISMLGFFQMSTIQTLASKVPISKKYPRTAIFTMGTVSGLISAPCTGPVLSTILLLIAQNKNPITGFTFMFFYALGFGLPYIALTLFSKKLTKVPKLPRLLIFIKYLFASMMFALTFYYLKSLLQEFEVTKIIYTKPDFLVLIVCLLFIALAIYFSTKKTQIGKISRTILILPLTLVTLFITLFTTNGFIEKPITTKNLKSQTILWEKDLNSAIKQAQQQQKPLLIDIWADWCAACLEMKNTTWKNQELINLLNQNYIPVQLDYSDLSSDIESLLSTWKINGLPAVVIFKKLSNTYNNPEILLLGYSSAEKVLNAVASKKKERQ
ncbi:protein-disulfide reductase DsbD family protein [Spirobacillus cienkowskii]|uniref:protein-disulfide reductase DsbD family protein n=1 Tax=Spirobacillus cienkowskii TaxID=495820 RepID=UPI0030CE791C